jgi:hypothetical protein
MPKSFSALRVESVCSLSIGYSSWVFFFSPKKGGYLALHRFEIALYGAI